MGISNKLSSKQINCIPLPATVGKSLSIYLESQRFSEILVYNENAAALLHTCTLVVGLVIFASTFILELDKQLHIKSALLRTHPVLYGAFNCNIAAPRAKVCSTLMVGCVYTTRHTPLTWYTLRKMMMQTQTWNDFSLPCELINNCFVK